LLTEQTQPPRRITLQKPDLETLVDADQQIKRPSNSMTAGWLFLRVNKMLLLLPVWDTKINKLPFGWGFR
jgi:hypothetical protein